MLKKSFMVRKALNMRKRSCLDIAFFKESCLTYLLNFHYIVLFSIFQLISSVLLILSGPAWIAMCHCLRQPAEGKKVRFKDYFLCFWQYTGVGMLYSVIICSAMTGIFFGSILGNAVDGSALAVSSQICASLLLALTIWLLKSTAVGWILTWLSPAPI